MARRKADMMGTDSNTSPETIKILIANPELSNHEAISGVLHTFPTTKADLQKSLAAIRLDGVTHSRFVVHAYGCGMDGLATAIPNTLNLDELNYLMIRLGEINKESRAIFSAVMQTREYTNLRDIINVTENIGCFDLQPASTPEMFGEYLTILYGEYFADDIEALKSSEHVGRRELAGYIEMLEACVDKNALGWHKADNEHGHFTSAGYLTRTDADFVEIYNTPSDIPDDCRVFAYPGEALIREAIEHENAGLGYRLYEEGRIVLQDAVSLSPSEKPKTSSPSLIDYLIKNKQQAKARPPAPKRGDEPIL
jgi:hypothetical protein